MTDKLQDKLQAFKQAKLAVLALLDVDGRHMGIAVCNLKHVDPMAVAPEGGRVTIPVGVGGIVGGIRCSIRNLPDSWLPAVNIIGMQLTANDQVTLDYPGGKAILTVT